MNLEGALPPPSPPPPGRFFCPCPPPVPAPPPRLSFARFGRIAAPRSRPRRHVPDLCRRGGTTPGRAPGHDGHRRRLLLLLLLLRPLLFLLLRRGRAAAPAPPLFSRGNCSRLGRRGGGGISWWREGRARCNNSSRWGSCRSRIRRCRCDRWVGGSGAG